MIAPIGIKGNFKDVPSIPSDILLKDTHLLIPPGFEDILEFQKEEHTNSISLTLLNDSNRDNTIINIEENFFNPSLNGAKFPKFIIEQSVFYGEKIDYFKDSRDKFIFTHLELFYVVLQQRLSELQKFSDAFGNLINSDIRQIKNFIDFTPSTAYNARVREDNSYIILSIFDAKTKELKRVGNSQCLGNILKYNLYIPREEQMLSLLNTLPIHFSSESMGESSKFVIKPYEEELYRSVGYGLIKDKGVNKGYVLSLFPPKQNIPARNKTHVTSDACEIVDYLPTSPFIQDYLVNETKDGYIPKDAHYVEALCVIHPMEEQGKYLFGEVDASVDFVKNKVYTQDSVTDQFLEILVEENVRYPADKHGVVNVGINLDKEVLSIKDCCSVTLLRSPLVGTLGVQKLVFKVERHAGNARIDSNTGLKGVTTCRNNLGNITLECGRELKPSLCFGMNSFKAGGNGIVLARAALATKLGYYKPKHVSGLLNTMNEEEINNASDSLPSFTYKNSMGETRQVQIGLVYARYTELCYIYKKFEPKPFSFEAGRVLASLPDPSLFTNIWKDFVVQDHKEYVMELEKILLDESNIFKDKIPTYTVEALLEKKIFGPEDIILNIRTAIPSMSKLLDEEWNKGFFINFREHNGGIVRFPSAKLLNNFCTTTDDKMYMYPSILVVISKIISHIINRNFGLLYPRNEESAYSKNTPIVRYLSNVKGLLFTSEDRDTMLIQALSRPEVPGFGLKQSSDWILPDNVCLIMCNKLYKQVFDYTIGDEDCESHNHLVDGLYGFHGRAPFLWSEQACPVRIWNQDDFRIYLFSKYNIKLEDYINTKWNNDVVIFSNNVLAKSQSDVDGDYSTTYTPKGLLFQKLLREYANPNTTSSERDWIKSYVDGEKDSNSKLIDVNGNLVKHKYQLYKVYLQDFKAGARDSIDGFVTYLVRAIVAKGNIGTATNDGWVFNMLLDLYIKYYEDNNGRFVANERSESRAMFPLSIKDRNELSFKYTQALQDFVVRGVKHSDNGSKDFEILFLREFWKPENNKKVMTLLTAGLKMNPLLASRMFSVITWAKETGFLSACGSFLRLYNKGAEPTDKEAIKALEKNEEYIQQNTYFGNLLEPVYLLRKHSNETKKERKAIQKKALEQLTNLNSGNSDDSRPTLRLALP